MIQLLANVGDAVPFGWVAAVVGPLAATCGILFYLLVASWKARSDDKDAALKKRDDDVEKLVGAINVAVMAIKELQGTMTAAAAAAAAAAGRRP